MFDHGWTSSEGGFDPAAHGDADLVERVADLERRRTMLDAEEAAVLAELDARGTCDRDFGLKTAGWLAREATLPAPVAKARVRVAVKLRRWFPLVAAALAAGEISWDHARVIVEVANPRIIDVVADNQIMLLTLAQRCRFEPWRAEVHALARLWDHDGGYDPNEDPASNRLSHGKTIDGLTSLAATLTGDNGTVVTQAIETKADELYRRAVRDHQTCPDLDVPTRATLRALALTELIREALGVDLHATKAPQVEASMVVHADDPTTFHDPDGIPLADGTTRVLGCDPVMIPLIVDSLGVPLDMGDTIRFATAHQRRAVRTRDGGCAFPGCDAPARWCDVHHCIHDEHGGATDVCNLVCLCRHHHTVVHRKGWSVHLDTDGWAIITTPSRQAFWGQRHGRQREGPAPDTKPTANTTGAYVAPGRYQRREDPRAHAYARQHTLQRLDALRPRAA
jgi:hypothetical protein